MPRKPDEYEVKLAKLRAALVEGEQSGRSTPFDFDDFLASKRTKPVPRGKSKPSR